MDRNTTDEQDLVKALDGAVAGLGASGSTSSSAFAAPAAPGSEPVILPGSPVAPSSLAAPGAPTDGASASPLDAIKKDALVELRPLVDKLTLSPEEKFDTYLLLIRSTDDAALIAPAHDAAKAIPDETRRAQALLDIIKEIDYLSQPKNQ